MNLQAWWDEFKPVLFRQLPTYKRSDFRRDIFSGLTVAVVALPLALAFAIASGVSPERGLFTAIVAGFVISLFGGSRLQIGGPTGAFVAVLYIVVERHGYDGLVLATLMAGMILIALGLTRMGSFIKFIPYPVIAGFTTGIAVIILTTQFRDFFGLDMATVPGDFIARMKAYADAALTYNLWAVLLGALTLGVILLMRRFVPQVPGAIVGVIIATVIVQVFNLPVETIDSRFGGLPQSLPMPELPAFDWAKIQAVMPDAVAIAFLAGIESLLSALIVDGMTGERHQSNTELIGQGMGNIASVLFGGIAATGAIARTAVNVKSGAASPISGILHALFLLLFVMVAAPLAGAIPLAALAGVLFFVAWNMAELHLFRRLMNAPRSDVIVLWLTFLLTVLVDITVAVQVGVGLAALLFMKRMSEVTDIKHGIDLTDEDTLHGDAKPHPVKVPDGVALYRVNGPFFFGAADKMAEVMSRMNTYPKVLILRIKAVPIIDATGLHMLAQLIEKCHKQGTVVMLAGVQPTVHRALRKMKMDKLIGEGNMQPSTREAIKHAKALLKTKKPL